MRRLVPIAGFLVIAASACGGGAGPLESPAGAETARPTAPAVTVQDPAGWDIVAPTTTAAPISRPRDYVPPTTTAAPPSTTAVEDGTGVDDEVEPGADAGADDETESGADAGADDPSAGDESADDGPEASQQIVDALIVAGFLWADTGDYSLVTAETLSSEVPDLEWSEGIDETSDEEGLAWFEDLDGTMVVLTWVEGVWYCSSSDGSFNPGAFTSATGASADEAVASCS